MIGLNLTAQTQWGLSKGYFFNSAKTKFKDFLNIQTGRYS